MGLEDIKTVAVLGAGTMGEGIAQVFAQQEMQVTLADINPDVLERSRIHIMSSLELFMEYGLISETPPAVASKITYFREASEAVHNCDFVVETISEVLEEKKKLYAQLDSLPANVIIASNTSSIPITQLAENMKTSHRVIGVHYFNPPQIMPLVEIHLGENTGEQVFEKTYQLMTKVGKKPIIIRKAIPGFVVNRITGAMMREIYHLLEEGVVTPEDLDTAMKNSTGFKMSCLGPMELEDMAGLDIASKVHARTFETLENSREIPLLLREKVNRNELGVKSGEGWLDYGGMPREQITERINRVLLQQWALLKSRR